MDDKAHKTLLAGIRICREKAVYARLLAESITDAIARAGMLDYAAELDEHANALAAQATITSQEKAPADAVEDIAAVKPPGLHREE